MGNLEKISLKYTLGLGIIGCLLIGGCKQRDDYPEFDREAYFKASQEKDKEIIDTQKSWYVTTLEDSKNKMFKSFISDTTWTLSEGVEYAKIVFIDGLDQRQMIHVVQADIKNPKVKVVSMSAYGVALNNRQVLDQMTADNEGIGGKILASINGDNMSTSTTNTYGITTNGFVYYDKVMKAVASTNANKLIPYLGVKKSGEVFLGNSPNITTYPTTWVEQSELVHQVSGPTWLMYGPNNTNTASTSVLARSIVGVNQDESKLFFVVLEGNRPNVSVGMGLPNMATLLRGWGMYKGFMPYYSQYGQMTIRQEDSKGKTTFPLVNAPTTSAGVIAPGTLANGIAIVVPK
ncbi:phosphodiester glycosidase family protein [Sphingobacterium tabacisoli]|uniref:Phosphodiester glycosidase family protein n=1 Tax=Sphingobacterium tabacisoli TaxID=2044855 RepID=A0ABW5KZJ7_9SPHI|nr:phosphodiester glycosidase family protein [Sphingobacterium tabacisoli]